MMNDQAVLQSRNTIQQNVRDSREVDLHRLLRQGDRIIKELKDKTQKSMVKDYSLEGKSSVPRNNCSSVDSASGRHAGKLRISPNSPQNTLNSRNNAERSNRKQLLSPKNDYLYNTQTQLTENTQRLLHSGRTLSLPLQQKLELKLAQLEHVDTLMPSTNVSQSLQQNRKLKEFNKDLQQLVGYLQKSLKEYEGIINRYRQTIEQKEQETEAVRQHSSIMVTKYEQQIRKLNLMLDQRKKKCLDLEKASQDLQNDNSGLREEIVHLHEKFAKKVKKMKQKNISIKDQLNSRIDQYQKELQVVSESKFRLEKDYSLLQSHLNSFKEDSDQKDLELSSLKELLTQKCAKIIEYEEFRRLQQSEMREKQIKMIQENKILVSANSQLYSQIAGTQQDSSNLNIQKELQLNKELLDAKNKILIYEEKINRLSSEIESNRTSRLAERIEIEQLRKVVQTKEHQIREMRKMNLEFQSKLADQQTDIFLNSPNEELRNQIFSLRSQNQKLTDFIQGLQKSKGHTIPLARPGDFPESEQDTPEVDDRILEIPSKMQNETERKDCFRKGYAELQRKADQLDKELESLRVSYERDQSDKKRQELALQQVKRQNAKLRQEIEELNEMHSHMYGQIDTLHINRSSETWEDRLEDKNSMEALLKLREREISQLQERIKAQVEKYNRLLENSTAEFDSLMGLNCELSEKLLQCEEELQNLKGLKLQPLQHSEIQMSGASNMSKNTVGFMTSQENDEVLDSQLQEFRLSINQLATQNRDLKQNMRSLKRQIQSMEDDIRFERRRNNHLEAIFTKSKTTTEPQLGTNQEYLASQQSKN